MTVARAQPLKETLDGGRGDGDAKGKTTAWHIVKEEESKRISILDQ